MHGPRYNQRDNQRHNPRHNPRQARFNRLLAAAAALLLTTVGCHHTTQQAVTPPPPPLPKNSSRPSPAIAFDDTSGRPVSTETGLASWYGPSFHHHAAADGTIFDQDAMTAAHRTLPLGSTVRVTNVATGEQVLVRITDRGPFVAGRVLDLSMGAARAIGLYRLGVAKVRVEAFAHISADPPGRWAVQTGAFKTQQDATDLKTALQQRYRTARVVSFAGPTGFWVRIDPATHTKADALQMQDWIGAPDTKSQAYLVRLD